MLDAGGVEGVGDRGDVLGAETVDSRSRAAVAGTAVRGRILVLLLVGADLGVMQRDAEKMRGAGPIVFACIRDRQGLDAIIDEVLAAREARASS